MTKDQLDWLYDDILNFINEEIIKITNDPFLENKFNKLKSILANRLADIAVLDLPNFVNNETRINIKRKIIKELLYANNPTNIEGV